MSDGLTSTGVQKSFRRGPDCPAFALDLSVQVAEMLKIGND
jgi:hypothetical protein